MHPVRTRPQPAKGVIAAKGRHIYEVAAAVGYNANTFGAILNRHQPVPEHLPALLAAELGVDVVELFDEGDE